MSSRWDKKYAGANKEMIEELAKLRHNQMRAWSRNIIQILNQNQLDGKSLEDFGAEIIDLMQHNWVDYEKVPEELKVQSRIFAYAVLDILKKYSNK